MPLSILNLVSLQTNFLCWPGSFVAEKMCIMAKVFFDDELKFDVCCK